MKKTNGTEPPYVGRYGFLNRPDIFVERKRNDFAPKRLCFNLWQEARKHLCMQTIRLGTSSLIGSRLAYRLPEQVTKGAVLLAVWYVAVKLV